MKRQKPAAGEGDGLPGVQQAARAARWIFN